MNEPRVPGVTLVMPMYNEVADITAVLASIAAQRYPHDALWLVVADGGSTDGCDALVADWLATSGIAGTIVRNPRRRIPISLNLALAHARSGDYVVRLDAHTTYDPAYVATIVQAFEETPASVACVGGIQCPAPSDRFAQALVAALHTNPMGLGGAGFRRGGPSTHPARSVYLGAWRPGVVAAVGGFDESWDANEDSELAARLRRNGYETWAIPVHSAYRVKGSLSGALKKWMRYGYWRAQTLRSYPEEIRLRHLAPPCALLCVALLLLTPLRGAVGVLYGAYVLGVFSRRAAGERFAVTAASCVFFPLTQIAWTFGLVRGVLLPRKASAGSPREQTSRARRDRAHGLLRDKV